MFEAKRLTFYYCISPVHMGAGSAVGAIDNPIQREVHSRHPVLNGAGIKGAIRHHVTRLWDKTSHTISELFGPETTGSDLHAGAISFTDGQLVLFPVRSLTRTFMYVTCPYALARLKRMAEVAGLPTDWQVPAKPQAEQALAPSKEIGIDGKLTLESYQLTLTDNPETAKIAAWLQAEVYPGEGAARFFQEKIKTDFAVVPDEVFSFFVENATVVEPHVRIDDATGTAADGALFYTENLPPESVMVGLTLASLERTKNKEKRRTAEEVLQTVLAGETNAPGINDTIVQMGGDATTGRGLIRVHAVGAKGGK